MPPTRLIASLAAAAFSLALPQPVPAFAEPPDLSAPSAVPVTTATVTRRDVPVVVHAIGTVQPFQTVTVRARVDGTLEAILFTEGQTVKPGDLLAQLDPRPYQAVLDQALAKKAADEAVLTVARSDLTRYAELANAQVASRQKFEQARAAVAQAEANLRGDDANIAAAQLNLGFTRIAAPIQGRVGLRQIDPGNFIRVADPSTTGIVTISQIQPITVLFTLPQDELPQVQAAMRHGKLPVVAYSSNGKTQLAEGQLLTTDSTIDPATGTIKLKAVFGNPEETLWPGQFVSVELRLHTRHDALTVPSAAIQRGPEGLYVYAVKPDSTVARQQVVVQQDDGAVAVLASGLEPGQAVVVSGQSRLTNGTRVAARAADTAG